MNIGAWDADSGDVLDCAFVNNIAADPQSPPDVWVIGTTHYLDYNSYYRPSSAMQAVWQEIIHTWPQYLAASHLDSHSVYSDPLLANPDANDFTLQPTSPCIDAGTFLTQATNAGPGTSLQVSDARYFSDGMDLIEADLIRVGTSDTVRVVDIHYPTNTLTLAASRNWSSGDGVTYAYKGNAPDIGAHEHDPATECDCPFQSDMNADGFVDSVDLSLQIDVVFFGGSDPQDFGCPTTRSDFNNDGFADSVDLSELIDHVFFGGPLPADPCGL